MPYHVVTEPDGTKRWTSISQSEYDRLYPQQQQESNRIQATTISGSAGGGPQVTQRRAVDVPDGVDRSLLEGMTRRYGDDAYSNQYGSILRQSNPSYDNPYGINSYFEGADQEGNPVSGSGTQWQGQENTITDYFLDRRAADEAKRLGLPYESQIGQRTEGNMWPSLGQDTGGSSNFAGYAGYTPEQTQRYMQMPDKPTQPVTQQQTVTMPDQAGYTGETNPTSGDSYLGGPGKVTPQQPASQRNFTPYGQSLGKFTGQNIYGGNPMSMQAAQIAALRGAG